MTSIPRWLRYALGFILLGVFVMTGLFRPIQQWAQTLFLPVTRWFVSFSSSVSNAQNPDDRVHDLENRLTAVTADYVRLRALEEENRGLRAQARFLDRSGYDSVGARVIRRDLEGQRASFLIDRGREDALEIGQAVVTDNGVMIGKITQIYDRVAEVTLLTDAKSRLASALQGEGRLTGVLEGKGNGAMVLTYVPSSAQLKTDQLLITAGTEEKVPANLPIGFVSIVRGKPTDPFIDASIESLVRFDEVTLVSVLRPTALAPKL